MRRAAEVLIRSVEWRRGRVVIRSVKWHRGRLRCLSGRWNGTEGGAGRYQVGGMAQRVAEVAIPAEKLRYPASVDMISRRAEQETK